MVPVRLTGHQGPSGLLGGGHLLRHAPVEVQGDLAAQPVHGGLEPVHSAVQGEGAQPLHPGAHRLFLLIQDGLQVGVEAGLGQLQHQQAAAVHREPGPALDNEVPGHPLAQIVHQTVVGQGYQAEVTLVDVRAVLLHPGGQADGGGPQLLPLAAPAAEAAGPGDGQDVQLLRQKVLAQGAELLGDLRGVLPRLPLLSPPLLPLLFLGDLPALFFEKSEHGPNPPLSADLYFPVEPKPPAPRWVSSSWSTIFTWAWTTGTTISWAMRSAGWMT